MRAMIILRFPGQRTYSPERQVLPLSVGVPAFADVRYPTVTAEAFSESHTDTQVEFRKVLLPQAAMVQALQSGSVRAIWQDVVWKVQTSTQEDDGTLTLTAEREKAYEVSKERPIEINDQTIRIGDDTPTMRFEEGA